MIEIKGMGVSPGIAYGKVFVFEKVITETIKKSISSPKEEIARLHLAIKESILQLNNLHKETEKKIGKKEASIFEAHILMLEDQDFIERIQFEIEKNKINAQWAVEKTRDFFVDMFSNMDSDYMKERTMDIKDISYRLIRILDGRNEVSLSEINKEAIVIAKDLTPSDTAEMNPEKVIGIITELGGKTSHSAIIAKTMGIPAVVGITGLMNKINSDKYVIFDGETGYIYIEPTEEIINKFTLKKNDMESKKQKLKSLVGTKSITIDGHTVEIAANIAGLNDIESVISNDAEGIGLFRTEFLYMNRESPPSENEQFEVYKYVAEKIGNKPVIIRTLDIGGDKEVSYLNIKKEDNPFLGFRAIRLCLDKKELFLRQLKAILRASVYGNIRIMFPMICTLEELYKAKEILNEAKEQLRKQKVLFSESIKIGIMIETPAAAIMSDILAKEVDFFSIGTNDLIQYTLAVDRLNDSVSYLYSFYQPAVLRLIKMVVENGHKEGIRVGMCGEAAADDKLIPIWVGMGIDELSMAPSNTLRVREKIRNISQKDAKKTVRKVLGLISERDTIDFLNK